MPDMPRITILMPVRNSATTLCKAVESVLHQTQKHFEFLIIDDASTDETVNILKRYCDPRIILLRNETNLGVAMTLNRGIESARGSYIARMDADDICEPDRLERQMAFMEKYPGLGLTGSFVRRLGDGLDYVLRFPRGSECLRSYVLLGNPLAHPTVIFRRDELNRHGFRYNSSCRAAQDYELWSRCLRVMDADNLDAPLVHWRANARSVTSARFSESNRTALQVQRAELARLGISVGDEDLAFHRQIGNGSGFSNYTELQRAEEWLKMLLRKNDLLSVYPSEGLRQAVAFVWFRVCLNSTCLGPRVWLIYYKSSISEGYRPVWNERLVMIVNAFLRFRKEPTGRLSEKSFDV
jgi:glycosyltransferase involved in cell wall biosynthesis